MNHLVTQTVLIAALATAFGSLSAPALASGGGSGLATEFVGQGHYGLYVEVNPYGIAPLTAIVRNNGHVLESAHVRIEPKTPTSSVIEYDVSRSRLLTHGGIPVFGLYPGFKNTVTVSYVEKIGGKLVTRNDKYSIYAAPCQFEPIGLDDGEMNGFKVSVKKATPAFKDRLYLINTWGVDKEHNSS